ncbi:BtrH N-terminal domain-containing protein [Tumebacillus permanentifrigoris]|uniref:Butirosin biosynthesis protein H-like n=1 Tax=Tumebacillus permanentifrigoris TaxID=378543 RepID=A0A316DAA6_9BACL|nr:BtrH N-terminal domain-containing protein [Tumebacillus permanentifrigoris]PWK14308.1 butirosin biosynthesis protein H-like [Tumebacillus permanentifrigoris]
MIKQNEDLRLGGVYCETTAARHLFDRAGLVAAHNGRPLSEAMLFGISGGIGFMYFNFEYEGHPPSMYIGTAHRYKTKFGALMDNLYQRVGVQTVVKTSMSEKVAEKNLRQALEQGTPVLLNLCWGGLPYSGTNEMYADYAVVVTGFHEQEGVYEIADRASVPLTIKPEALSRARAGIASLKNRSLTLAPTDQSPLDLREAIVAGIRACFENMLNPPTPVNNFGLKGLEKWANVVNDPKNKKGWPQVFATDADLFQGLFSTFRYLEIGNGGGAMRELYAAFLTEAAEVLNEPELLNVATQYRECARYWTEVAHAALPDSEPLWKELKHMTSLKERLLLEKGMESPREIEPINERLHVIATAMRESFAFDASQRQELLDDLHRKLVSLGQLERAAISSLQKLFS